MFPKLAYLDGKDTFIVLKQAESNVETVVIDRNPVRTLADTNSIMRSITNNLQVPESAINSDENSNKIAQMLEKVLKNQKKASKIK